MALKRNLAWMGLGQGAFFVLQFGGSVILARLLTPYEMGIFAFATAIAGILALVQSFGVGNYIIREASLTPRDISTAFTVNALISLLLSAALAAAGFVSRFFLNEDGVAEVLLLIAVVPLIGMLEVVPLAQLEREGRFKHLMAGGLARNLTAVTVTVACAFSGLSYKSMAIGQIAGAVVGASAINVLGWSHVQFRLSLEGWRKVTSFGAHMLAISGVNGLATRTSDLLLGRILGLAALGLFTRSNTVYRLFWDNLHLVIGRVIFVDLARRKREGESLRDSYLLICEVMTAVLWPAFVALAIMARPLFRIVYGEPWVGAALPFSLLALGAVFQVSITMTWEIFTVSGETARQARLELIRTAIGVALFTAGCFISLAAAAASRILEAIISMLLYRPHLQRMTETELGDFLAIYRRSALLTVLAAAPPAALMAAWRGSPEVPFWQLLAVSATGLALWGIGVRLMKHPVWNEVLRLRARFAY